MLIIVGEDIYFSLVLILAINFVSFEKALPCIICSFQILVIPILFNLLDIYFMKLFVLCCDGPFSFSK